MCVGAQVVLTWNLDLEAGLCNGARGVVEDVSLSGVMVKFVSGFKTLISYQKVDSEDDQRTWMSFMPLRLAYALTINKAQGMTIDRAVVVLDDDSSADFLYGRAYTALSRVRNLSCIKILNVSKECFLAHPDVVEFYKNI
jgi:ATP-dependent DNA helicase PIF1